MASHEDGLCYFEDERELEVRDVSTGESFRSEVYSRLTEGSQMTESICSRT